MFDLYLYVIDVIHAMRLTSHSRSGVLGDRISDANLNNRLPLLIEIHCIPKNMNRHHCALHVLLLSLWQWTI